MAAPLRRVRKNCAGGLREHPYDCHVRNCARYDLAVDEISLEEFLRKVIAKRLFLVPVLYAIVEAPPRVALCIPVGKIRVVRRVYQGGSDVFGSDHVYAVALAPL